MSQPVLSQLVLAQDAQTQAVKEGTALWALPTWVADFNPLHVGASVGHVLSLQTQNTPEICFGQEPAT
jgi:hypothetical protein